MVARKKKKESNKTHIMLRYGMVSFVFCIIGLLIIIRLFNTTIVHADEWNERAKRDFAQIDTIEPERGNILASNGSILACNLTVYDIKLDLRHDKIASKKSIPWAQIDSLADSLDVYFPRVENLTASIERYNQYTWHKRLKEEFEKDPDKRTRSLRLVKNGSEQDFAEIKCFPYIKNFGRRGPLYKEAKEKRIYPFGRMAYRSIGRVNEDYKTGQIRGYSGLEKDLDSLLYGHPGLAKRVAMTSGLSNWITTHPKRGYDILTTIDIDIQDMLEEELRQVCDSSSAEWGTAIIMEVKTGEIKAISNIERLDDGTYGEALNRAVLPFEPGSVMKPISLMIAFEDGLVKNVTDAIDCSPFQRTSDPHAPTVKSMKQVIEMSSNTGIARVIFRGYSADPSKFYDRLKSIGFFEPIRSGIAGECIPRIRKLLPQDAKGNNITMTARHLDLARQAYGYNTEIPPLYTLSIYNALANNGRYVRPHLVRALRDENGHDSIIPISYIRERICSEETAAKVRECIAEVVWGEHGTARSVRDERVKVAGKTGTAFPVEAQGYNRAKRRYAFAGFFPIENPKYSCIALILGPSGHGAGSTSGRVVKNMAIKMFARGMLDNASTFTSEKRASRPVLVSSVKVSPSDVKRLVNIDKAARTKVSTATMSGVPDVRGYDAPSAIRILELLGYNVRIQGAGTVVAQSAPPGTKLKKGNLINLKLNT